jgi:asparagine synthase (glutamine-hydrolysing)
MCGIAGYFGAGRPDALERMLNVIAHRGPDDQHGIVGEGFAIGARRLSILDPAHGRQPVSNERQTVWAAQNGEIYNFPDLRPELCRKGHRLTSRCDTELLPHLYEDYGPDLADHLDGMYAVAIWDANLRRGVLVRDRMGKKPLYYTVIDGALYFASEIKSLLQIPGFRKELNPEALHHYLSYKHVPAPLSIFRRIQAVPRASVLTYDVDPQKITCRTYWRPDFTPAGDATPANEEAIVDELDVLMRNAVRRRLLSDVPIGFFLSGGIDSSLTTAYAAELSAGPIKTFTLTYKDDGNPALEGKRADEHWARLVAQRYGTEHIEARIGAEELLGNLEAIVRAFDEPYAGTNGPFFLSRLMGQHVKVAMAGDGADELFGSYLSHRLAFPLANLDEYLTSRNPEQIAPFENQVDYLQKLRGAEEGWRARLLVISEAEKRRVYTPEFARLVSGTDTTDHLAEYSRDLSAQDPLNRVLESELRWLLPDQVLTYADRLSMCHSLEVRAPFLDTQLVNYVCALPGRLKMPGGQTKRLLKQLALRKFPEEMVHRRKEGFVLPVTHWLLTRNREFVLERLAPDQLRRQGIFDPQGVGELIEAGFRNATDYHAANKLLALLIFQIWYDAYLA